jgi:hypothetical protein
VQYKNPRSQHSTQIGRLDWIMSLGTVKLVALTRFTELYNANGPKVNQSIIDRLLSLNVAATSNDPVGAHFWRLKMTTTVDIIRLDDINTANDHPIIAPVVLHPDFKSMELDEHHSFVPTKWFLMEYVL